MSSSLRPEDPLEPGSLPSDPEARTERRQQISEEQKAVLDALPTAIGLVKDNRVLWVNQAFTTLFGYTREEALNQPFVNYFDDRQHDLQATQLEASLVARAQPYPVDLLMRRKNGKLFWGSVSGHPLFPEHPEAGLLWMLTDITARKQAEETLRLTRERLEAAQAHALVGSWELGPDFDARYWSKQMYALFCFDPELGVPAVERYLEHVHPDDRPRLVETHRQAIERHRSHRLTYRGDASLGGARYFEVTIVPEFDEQGQLVRVIGTTQDVTERTQSEQERSKLQEQLQQAIKMEAVGRLAGGVAHDFNNLLTIITGNVELALDELTPQDPLVQHLTEINEAASSAASLTKQLLAFSRRQLVEPKVLNLNDLVGNLQKMLGRLIGEDIALELRLSGDLGAVRIDPGQFDQVIVNLAVNARDAMPKGGRLTVETANIDLDEDYCRAHGDLNAGPFVSLAVTDSGDGMAPEVLSHIFEPFFTTKPLGVGTGLGLSVIFGVVKQAGGTIETYSELGHGTTFKIYLPRVDAPPQKLEKAKVAIEALRGTETILLVEDNDNVRELTTIILRRLGYDTLVAANGRVALALLKSERPAIDLLLTDLVMPEMSGRELSDLVRRLYPNIAVLYCSGYTEDTFVRHGLASENLQFIGKPFTLQQLGVKVRQVLDERRKTFTPT